MFPFSRKRKQEPFDFNSSSELNSLQNPYSSSIFDSAMDDPTECPLDDNSQSLNETDPGREERDNSLQEIHPGEAQERDEQEGAGQEDDEQEAHCSQSDSDDTFFENLFASSIDLRGSEKESDKSLWSNAFNDLPPLSQSRKPPGKNQENSFLFDLWTIKKRLDQVKKDHCFRKNSEYPLNITQLPPIPNLPALPPFAETCNLSQAIQSVMQQLSRIAERVELIESTGERLEALDQQLLLDTFSSLNAFLHPLSPDQGRDLKLSMGRLEMLAMRAKAEVYRDLATQSMDLLDDLRQDAYLSRTAFEVSRQTADEIFDAYLLEIQKAYAENPLPLASLPLQSGLKASLEAAGYKTAYDIAKVPSKTLVTIPGIKGGRLTVIRDFFVKNKLPALCLATRPEPTAGMGWASVNGRNGNADFQWKAPKCYGDVVFQNEMDGVHSSIYFSATDATP